MIKIVADSGIPFLEGRFSDEVELLRLPADKITHETLLDADGLIIRTRTICNKELLEDTKVKLISTATIGMDHIDTVWCKGNGITVKNAPGCNAPAVAQYVLTSLLKSGFNIEKDTLGIIGYGNVGRIVKEWATQLGIKVIINDPPRKQAGFNDVDYREIEELLTKSDAVTLHVPLTKDSPYPTFYLIAKKEFGIMKPGALLINSSRGGVVEEREWKQAMKDKGIRAVIDVWENEPQIDRDLLIYPDTLIATPHIAGYSAQGKMRATGMALQAVKDFFGIPVDFSGLEIDLPGNEKMTKERLEASYNPETDSEALRKSPGDFEKMRNSYAYRQEP